MGKSEAIKTQSKLINIREGVDAVCYRVYGEDGSYKDSAVFRRNGREVTVYFTYVRYNESYDEWIAKCDSPEENFVYQNSSWSFAYGRSMNGLFREVIDHLSFLQ